MSLPLTATRGNSAGVCLREKSQSHHSTRGTRQRDLPGKTGEGARPVLGLPPRRAEADRAGAQVGSLMRRPRMGQTSHGGEVRARLPAVGEGKGDLPG